MTPRLRRFDQKDTFDTAPHWSIFIRRMIMIAETEPYRKKAAKLLSEEERNELIAYLSEHPASGAIIQGTNGVRKPRWARSGGGKSGGYRIIYYFQGNTRYRSIISGVSAFNS